MARELKLGQLLFTSLHIFLLVRSAFKKDISFKLWQSYELMIWAALSVIGTPSKEIDSIYFKWYFPIRIKD